MPISFQEQEEVVSILCTLLSQVVQLQTQPGSLRERLLPKAQEIADRYSREGYKCLSNTVLSFTILKDLLSFFDHYHSKQYSLALKILDELRIIPLRSSELDEYVTNFKRLNLDVRPIIPDVLLATMNMLFDQYQKLKGNEFVRVSFQDPATQKVINWGYVRLCVVFLNECFI